MRLMNAMTLRLALFYATLFLFIGVHLPFWPVWLSHKGMSEAQIGYLIAVITWIRAIAPALIAQAADRRGAVKSTIVAMLALSAVGNLLFFLTDSFWPILLVMALTTLTFAGVIPMGESVAMRAADAHRFDYGRVRLWGSITFIVASYGAGALLEGQSGGLVLWMVIATLAVAAIAALGLPAFQGGSGRRASGFPVKRLLTNPTFLIFTAAAGLSQASHAAYYAFATLHWRNAGHSTETIGLLWAEGVIAEILLFTVSGWIVAKLGPMRLLAIAVAGGLIRWTVVALTAALPALIAVQWLHAATFAAAHLAAMHFILRAVPPEVAATAQSLYGGLGVGVMMGLTTVIAGTLYDTQGGLVFIGMAAMSALGGVATYLLVRRWDGGRIEGI